MLAGESLHETAQRLIGNLQREVHFAGCPTKCIHTRPAAPDAPFYELRETRVISRLQEDVPSFVAMKDYVVEPTWYVQSS